MLTIQDLSFSFGKDPILQGVSFSLKKGEIGSLIGISGSGKTTLFKLMTGIYQNTQGTIFLNDQAVPIGCRHVSYMMQEDLLLPWRTVMDNLLLLSELSKKEKTPKEEVLALLHEIGLSQSAHLYPHQLSMGMKQRVSLARAVLQRRPILLLDEPFASLDVSFREHMYTLLQEIRSKYQTTILMITHDFRDALSLSDRVFFLKSGKIHSCWSITAEMRSDPLVSTKLQDEMRSALMSA